jgi:hypothetical protein
MASGLAIQGSALLDASAAMGVAPSAANTPRSELGSLGLRKPASLGPDTPVPPAAAAAPLDSPGQSRGPSAFEVRSN